MPCLTARSSSVLFLMTLTVILAGCAGSGRSGGPLPPSVSGTHTVMGRAFFPGGIMILMDAHLQDGSSYGTMQYSRVETRGDNTLRVDVEVRCVGLFRGGSEAIVTGPVARVDGDYRGSIGIRDWWLTHVKEGGEEGDLVVSSRYDQDRALTLCQTGPSTAATLRAVDGDLSIH